jgi:hypothetical protein
MVGGAVCEQNSNCCMGAVCLGVSALTSYWGLIDKPAVMHSGAWGQYITVSFGCTQCSTCDAVHLDLSAMEGCMQCWTRSVYMCVIDLRKASMRCVHVMLGILALLTQPW